MSPHKQILIELQREGETSISILYFVYFNENGYAISHMVMAHMCMQNALLMHNICRQDPMPQWKVLGAATLKSMGSSCQLKKRMT